MEELLDYKYNENLPSLQIITTSYRDKCLEREENISKYASKLITNKGIQKVNTIDGEIADYLYTSDGIKNLKIIINTFF